MFYFSSFNFIRGTYFHAGKKKKKGQTVYLDQCTAPRRFTNYDKYKQIDYSKLLKLPLDSSVSKNCHSIVDTHQLPKFYYQKKKKNCIGS